MVGINSRMSKDEKLTQIISESQASLKTVSFDELLDDIFGLSAKSLKSIFLLFKRPAEYFKAAKAPFWENRLSPSFRIYLGLTALTTAMRFLYRDENSPMVKLYASQFELIKENPPNGLDPNQINSYEMAVTTLKWMLVLSPIISTVFFCLLGLLYWGYGEKLNPVVRIRYVFAALIPASVISALSAFPMYFLPESFTMGVSLMGLLLMFMLIWLTAYRGAFSAVDLGAGRIGRATVLSILIFVVMMAATFIAIFAGAAIAFIELLKDVKG